MPFCDHAICKELPGGCLYGMPFRPADAMPTTDEATKRPPLDDEYARRLYWVKVLDRPGMFKDDVVRDASHALALRDAHIARLEEILREVTHGDD